MSTREIGEITSIARSKQQADAATSAAMEKIRFAGHLAWAMGAIVVFGALWFARVEYFQKDCIRRLDDHDKVFTERQSRIAQGEVVARGIEAKVDAYISGTNTALGLSAEVTKNLRLLVDENRSEIKELRPKVEEMWWRKGQGLNNKDVKSAP